MSRSQKSDSDHLCPADEMVQKLKATMDCGFTLLIRRRWLLSGRQVTICMLLGAGQRSGIDIAMNCML